MVVNAFLSEGDKVVIQSPVYHPFHIVPEGNGLEVVRNPLIHHEDGSYSMNFDNLESILRRKVLLHKSVCVLCGESGESHRPGWECRKSSI